jgi:hypothetical protein
VAERSKLTLVSEHQASRTLLKSPPELWTECSDAQSLARHLGDTVGEIRIIRLEPETAVAWEGDHISGTVRLEPSGWGTKVTLTTSGEESAPAPEQSESVTPPGPDSVTPPGPESVTPPGPEQTQVPAENAPPSGFVARMRRWFAPEPSSTMREPAPPPAIAEPEPPEPPEPAEPTQPAVFLVEALDSLGRAHHRPFSRA